MVKRVSNIWNITPAITGNPNARPPVLAIETKQTTGATFQVKNTKLYVRVVTLSINDYIIFLENIKQLKQFLGTNVDLK